MSPFIIKENRTDKHTHTMKLFLTYLFCGVSLLTCIYSCIAPIDIQTASSKPVLVISGNVSDLLEYQEVRLSSSSPFFDMEPNPLVSNAKVQIGTSTGDTFELEELPGHKGLYRTKVPFKGAPTVSYTLKVNVDFNKDGTEEEYTATTTMLEAPLIDSIQVRLLTIQTRTHFTSNLFAENPGKDQHYVTRYLINDTLATARLVQYAILQSDMLGEGYINGIWIYDFMDTERRNDLNEQRARDEVFMSRGDRVTLLMSSIDKGYFDFIAQCQKEYQGENPFFGGPPSNITTNLSNGAVGYFSSTATSKLTAIAPMVISR